MQASKVHFAILFAASRLLAQQQVWNIPPVRTSVQAANQNIPVVAYGTISGAHGVYKIDARADLSGLQDHITDLLATELNRNDACGERLSVEQATLLPAPPSGLLTASVHYERWACVKALGRRISKRVVAGNATVPVTLTPQYTANSLGLDAKVGEITADGSLGELLTSGSLGDTLREKIRQSILRALSKSANLEATLPPALASIARVSSASFIRTQGRLGIDIAAEVRIPDAQLRSLIGRQAAN